MLLEKKRESFVGNLNKMEKKKTRSSLTMETISLAPSRYFGGGASLLGGIGLTGRDSVTTTDSFTEEQHTMTAAELAYEPSEAEHKLMEEVTASVRERIVYGQGSTSWGLRWECGTVDEPDYLLGGWLSQVSRSILSSGITNGQARFCVLGDDGRLFHQCLDERLKVRRSIPYDEIHTVRPRCHESKKEGKPDIWYLQVYGKGVKWELMPIAKNDREIILRWTAALQFRSGTYDPSISGDAARARKAAVWAQSKYRAWKAKLRAQKRRERRRALLNRVASAIGVSAWEVDSSDDEEEGLLSSYSSQMYETSSSLINNAWSTVGSWLGLGGAATAAIAEEEEEKEPQDENDKPRRISTFVQYSNDLPPLQPGEVEDELWENQRWTPATGWTSVTLGKTERYAYTDRIGRGNYSKPTDPNGGIPLPDGWQAKGAFEVDKSGVNKGRCDKEGWCYSLDWPLLDADLARGRFIVHQGPKDFVRRRRWYRRRVSTTTSSNLRDTTSPILLTGWLGSKNPATSRWHSRIFVLSRPGLQIGATITKYPAITQFRFSFRDYESVIANGGVDGAKWRSLTDKHCSTVELDPRLCHLDQTVADAKYPGYFMVVLDGKKKTRMFNANDAMGRETWCKAIQAALEDALKANRPKTMRLVGGAFETTAYPTVIMDTFVLAPVDAVEEAFFQSPAVLAAVNIRSNFKNPQSTPWANGTSRTVTYEDDARGGKVMESWVRARTEPGRGFVVDRRIEAPGAQFGGEYAIKCRFVLIAAEMAGEAACRILVSMDVEFLKQTMMVGFITSGARKTLTTSLRDIWLPAVVGYLQGKGLLIAKPRSDASKITWGSSALGTSLSKQLGKQDSGQIQVGKI